MTDVVAPWKRSLMMAGIRGKNTKPELAIRMALHERGLRYRIHSTKLPGKPDLVFSRYNAVVLIHGCFWHGHGCALFKWPQSNPEFWQTKILGNRVTDRRVAAALRHRGWRILTVWECSLKGPERRDRKEVFDRITDWVLNGRRSATLGGRRPRSRG